MRTLQRAILMILLSGVAAVAVIAGVRYELAIERAALRDEFVKLAATHALERAGWGQVGRLRQAGAQAQQVCDEADRVEQDWWPQRTKLLCRLLSGRDAS